MMDSAVREFLARAIREMDDVARRNLSTREALRILEVKHPRDLSDVEDRQLFAFLTERLTLECGGIGSVCS